MKLAGAVLAGGQSRRMGRDKAMLVWNGEPLWRRQLRVLESCGAAPAALVRQPGQPDLGAPCWRDLRVGQGPLAGLEAALAQARAAGADGLIALAVDMPFTTAAWFHWLLSAAPEGGVATLDGRYEPLAAAYPVAALPLIEAHLAGGQRSLQSLVEHLLAQGLLRALSPPAALRPQLQSVNTPDACPSTIAK